MHFKEISKEVILILILSIVTAFTVNYFSSRGVAIFGEWDPSRGVVNAKSKDHEFLRDIELSDVEKVKNIYDTGKAVFVDARSHDAYKDGHIKGAEPLPLHQFDEVNGHFFSKHPITTFIITYCSGRDCDEGHRLAQYLLDFGYTDVMVFIDGFSQWEKRGYPINRPVK
jgi:3-mercaptopyruvate sulfurtransferase SseA